MNKQQLHEKTLSAYQDYDSFCKIRGRLGIPCLAIGFSFMWSAIAWVSTKSTTAGPFGIHIGVYFVALIATMIVLGLLESHEKTLKSKWMELQEIERSSE